MKTQALLLAMLTAGSLSAGTALAQQSAATGSDMQFTQEQTAGQGAVVRLSTAEVRQIQQALNQAGYDAGNIDGIWGSRTSQALSTFQQAQGLEPSGNLNLRTLDALGMGGGIAQGTTNLSTDQAAMESSGVGVQDQTGSGVQDQYGTGVQGQTGSGVQGQTGSGVQGQTGSGVQPGQGQITQ